MKIDGFHGQCITTEHAEYDAARAVWNGAIDRYPRAIARCTRTADVVAAVRFAREHDLEIAVRGGGHNVAGTAVCDDGIVIDLSAMRGVRVDPDCGTAQVHGDALWGDVDQKTQRHALATTGRIALGGGLGWLMRKHGLAGGQHQRYVDDSSALQSDEAVQDGNAILGHLFGSKEVSRNVASRVSSDTGIDVAMIKRFLPVAAAALMGTLSKQTAAGANLRDLGAGSASGAAGSLGGLLDVDGDGFGVDDLIALGKKLF